MRPGLELLEEEPGSGELVTRKKWYVFRFRTWLHRGDPVVWKSPWGAGGRLEEGGTTLITEVRIDREYLYNGFFYAVQGMRVGGTRTVCIAPHLAFGAKGIEGEIPPNALLRVEVHCVKVIEGPS